MFRMRGTSKMEKFIYSHVKYCILLAMLICAYPWCSCCSSESGILLAFTYQFPEKSHTHQALPSASSTSRLSLQPVDVP
jgi:hypothetical protein